MNLQSPIDIYLERPRANCSLEINNATLSNIIQENKTCKKMIDAKSSHKDRIKNILNNQEDYLYCKLKWYKIQRIVRVTNKYL